MSVPASRARAEGVSRVVLVDKPEGWTSYDVVRRSKGSFKGKIGHAGTLDPFATGLLLVLFGQATRLSSVFMDLPKEYAVTVRFGIVSTTGDPTGELTTTGRRTDLPAIVSALDGFRGEIVQRVPMTSAVKVGGERLYHKAHRGEAVDTPERSVKVYELTALAFDEVEQDLELVALTGKGTYVRTLAEDLGAALGVGAHAARLRRLRVGWFDAADAMAPDDLSPSRLLEPDDRAVLRLSKVLSFLPGVEVGEPDARRVANGNELTGVPDGLFRVHGAEGLLALYEGSAGRGRPKVVFPAPEE